MSDNPRVHSYGDPSGVPRAAQPGQPTDTLLPVPAPGEPPVEPPAAINPVGPAPAPAAAAADKAVSDPLPPIPRDGAAGADASEKPPHTTAERPARPGDDDAADDEDGPDGRGKGKAPKKK